MHGAESILDALRFRHEVQQNIVLGSYERHCIKRQPGMLCTELRQLAGICIEESEDGVQVCLRCSEWHGLCGYSTRQAQVPELVISCVDTKLEIQSLELPSLFVYADFDCRWHDTLLAIAHSASQPPDAHQKPGLLLLDTETGETLRVDLGSDKYEDDPSSLSEWSSSGYILVQCALGSEGSTYSVVDVQGQVVSCTADLPRTHMRAASCWTPDGKTAVLLFETGIWLWAPELGVSPSPCKLQGLFCSFAWSPDSSCLFVCQDDAQEVLAWTPGSVPREQLPLASARSLHCAFWGSHNRVGLLCGLWDDTKTFNADYNAIAFCSVTSSGLLEGPVNWRVQEAVHHSVPGDGDPLSPCRTLLALITAFGGSDTHKFGVEILDLTGRALQHHPLSFTPASITWASDCASLFVSDDKGLGSGLLLDFT